MPASRRGSGGGSAAASRSADLAEPASTSPTFLSEVFLLLFFLRLDHGTYFSEKNRRETDNQLARYAGRFRGWRAAESSNRLTKPKQVSLGGDLPRLDAGGKPSRATLMYLPQTVWLPICAALL